MFLDANAHTPLSPKAIEAFIAASREHGHASSPSAPGMKASLLIESARGKIAALLGAKSSNQIIFTASCTQACEWGAFILQNLDSGYVLKSPTEHPAIGQAVDKYFPNANEIQINKDGVIQKTEFNYNESVICIHVQNEIGIIQPINNIKCRYLLSDMSQSAGKININLSSLPVDIATFGAHKFCGPNIGIMYLKNVEYWKEFGTGSRYMLDRAGTPDVASIVASAAALEEAINTMPQRTQNMLDFRSVIEPELQNMGFDVIAKDADRIASTTFVRLGDGKGMKTLLNLGGKGIHVGLGSACGSLYAAISPLMDRLGIHGSPHDFIRISQWGEYGKKDAEKFIDEFRKVQ